MAFEPTFSVEVDRTLFEVYKLLRGLHFMPSVISMFSLAPTKVDMVEVVFFVPDTSLHLLSQYSPTINLTCLTLQERSKLSDHAMQNIYSGTSK